jgi:hypothetical protein
MTDGQSASLTRFYNQIMLVSGSVELWGTLSHERTGLFYTVAAGSH